MFRVIVVVATFVTLVSTLSAQTMSTSASVPDYPQAMVVNTFTNHIYILSESGNQLTDLDGTSGLPTYVPLPTMT